MSDVSPQTAAWVRELAGRPEVLGVLCVGSKNRGYTDELSDDDLEVVVTEEAFAPLSPVETLAYYHEGEPPSRRQIYDAQFLTMAVLEWRRDSWHDLNHWPYETAAVLFDRDGSVTRMARAIGRMEPEFRRRRLSHAAVDAWLTVDRARKMEVRGQNGAAKRLVIARGAKAVARLVFALEWRWVPFDYSLEPELLKLEEPTGAARCLVRAVEEDSADLLGESLSRLEDRLAAEGVPRGEGRFELFCELVHHPLRSERELHGIYY